MDIYEDAFDEHGPHHTDHLPHVEPVRFHTRDDASPRTGLELRCTREALGLSAHDFAAYTGIGLRTIQRWEQYRSEPIPPHAESAIRALEEHTALWEAEVAEAPQVGVKRDGWREANGRWLPESWWRSLVGRVRTAHPQLRIVDMP